MSLLQRVGIVGTGGMGRGIAESSALAGLETVLVKATAGAHGLDRPRRLLAESFERGLKKGKLSAAGLDAATGRLLLTADFDALADCDLVVESVVEDLDVKRRLLAVIEERLSPAAVLATNTSSLPLSVLADALRIPSRFLGLHFFSPVRAMPLCELAVTQRTYPAAVERARELAVRLHKTVVLVGDSSGYIVNRLLVPYLLDGMAALEAKLAPASSIDIAMKLGCNHPMGPLELADAIGLDVVYAMAKTMYRELGDRRYSPPALLRRLVGSAQLGKKTGRGIYDYSTSPATENPELWPVESQGLGA